MKIVIVCPGSRGDVVPYSGLGVALKNSGHEVAVATFEIFQNMVTDCGLEFRLIPGDPQRMLDASEGDPRWARHTGRMLSVAREAVRQLGPPTAEACRGADLLLLSAADSHGYHVAQAMGIPSMAVHLFPLEPTRQFPLVTMAGRFSFGGFGNRLSAELTRKMVNRTVLLKPINEFRRELGLRKISAAEYFRELAKTRWPIRYCFSEVLVPRPPDWREGIEVAGFLWPENEQDWVPDNALVEFINGGPAPVFVGFDLASTSDGGRMAETVMPVLRKMGLRVVVHGPKDSAYQDDDQVFVLGDVPYTWLFPQMSALVHRCGVGTTAAGLRAGVPSVSIPLGFDRPFWASRQAAIGASPPPIRVRDLTAERFSTAMSQVLEQSSYRDAAKRAAERLRAEDGAGNIVADIKKLFG